VVLTLKLDNRIKRCTVLAVLLLLCAALAWLILAHFIVNTLSDEGLVVRRSTLISAAAYFPQSGRLQARLAKAELAEAAEEADLMRAEAAALNAVRLAPWNSNHQLLLSAVRNLQGDLEATEAAVRTAVRLAPHSTQAHWQLANVLVRQDKLDEALKEFQVAVASDSGAALLPGALDLVWNLSDGNVDKLTQMVGNNPQRRLLLAQHLLKQARPIEAVAICKSIERTALLASSEATEFLNVLVAAGQLELAKSLWEYLSAAETTTDGQVLYNGGFERELIPALSQFDWKIAHSEYAILSVDTAVTHGGKRSLRINLTGRDTTVLGKELRQIAIVKPGARYRLECYAKTDRLVTTEALHIVVTDTASSTLLATSNPIVAGSSDWRPYTLDFVTASNDKAVLVTIKRTPRFSYDEPSRGTVWLDDFTLRETEPRK
jgi:tetratricopeptide (TPR) repeat protein